mmetsp:Transcript_94938/g.283502  ORF Transcript_94938/g.283502 Transcript_94938/m.283502 type:complete len:338 (+) Transcript_94938:97-1110(+)
METRQGWWVTPLQQRPWRGALGAAVTAGLSGILVGLAAGLWHHLSGRRRGQHPLAGVQSPAVVGPAAPAWCGDAQDCPPDELRAEFARAAAWVASSPALTTAAKLALYGWYKQANSGDCPAERPWGMEASAKWEAWREHRGASTAEAMRRYISALDQAAPGWRADAPGARAPRGEGGARAEGSGMATGPAVSLLQSIGDPSQAGEVDVTPVGQLCERIAEDDLDAAYAMLRASPGLAFHADKDGMTPLHWACDRGRIGVVRALLDMLTASSASSALVNTKDASGDTPLHFAVLTENVEIAQLLLHCRASPGAKNSSGESPLDLVTGEGWQQLFSKSV